MNERIHWVTAGLVFLGTRDMDMAGCARRAGAAIESLGHRVTGTRMLSEGGVQITTCCHTIRLELQRNVAFDGIETRAPLYLGLSMPEGAGSRRCEGQDVSGEMVLTHVLKALHWHLSADYVRWVGDSRLLTAADFVLITADLPGIAPQPHDMPAARQGTRSAQPALARTTAEITSAVLPSQVAALANATVGADGARNAGRHPAPDVSPEGTGEPQIDSLRQFLREIDASEPRDRPISASNAVSDLQRLAAWLMAYAVMLFALPVGLALLGVNLIKGENPRLACQAAALTGTFIALQSHGSTAQAMAIVETLLS